MKQIQMLEELYVVKSSNIARIGYDSGDAYVEFINGNIYKYPNTDKQVVDQLIKAESVGKVFSQTLKKAEKFEKLDHTVLVNSTNSIDKALNLLDSVAVGLNAVAKTYDSMQGNDYKEWHLEKTLQRAIGLLRTSDGNV